jgi:uncharacterized protein (TIGR03086 family)
MPEIDLHPATRQMAQLLAGVPDDALTRPTPCPEFDVGDLVDHVDGFARVFAASARKELGALTATPPAPAHTNLAPTWREDAAAHLEALADAWDAPDAWEGMTQAAGVDLPGATAGRIVLDELVVHAWDVARATGQPFRADDGDLQEIKATVEQFRSGNDGPIPGLFGPAVPVDEDAPLLDQVLGLTGRDPSWMSR